MMTRKHFEKAAALIANRNGYNLSTIQFDNGYNRATEDIANDLADWFEDDNPNFDRARFLTACGLG